MSYYNPFDLLDDEGAERPVRKAPKPAAPKPAQPAAPKQAPQVKAAATAKSAPSTAQPKKDNDAKPKQADAQKGKNDAVKKAPAQARPQQQQAAPKDDAFVSEKAPRINKGGERRDRDHRSHDRPSGRGRQFDRRSGTGRPANENKRAGAGKANWGNIVDGQEATEIPKEATEEKEEVAAPAEAEAVAETEEPPKSPEKELLSLDEYRELQKKKAVKVDAPKLREAGEGVDQSAWAGFAPLAKDADGEDAPLKKKKEVKKDVNGKEEKVSIEQFFRVTMPPIEGADSRRGRGNKGPRGDRRERRPGGQRFGGGDRRKSDGAAKSISIGDQSQFPSLGASPAPQQASSPAPVKA